MDVLEKPKTSDTNNDDDQVDHLFCCNKDIALCGADISNAEYVTTAVHESPDLCVVCDDLIFSICKFCGK